MLSKEGDCGGIVLLLGGRGGVKVISQALKSYETSDLGWHWVGRLF